MYVKEFLWVFFYYKSLTQKKEKLENNKKYRFYSELILYFGFVFGFVFELILYLDNVLIFTILS